MKHRSSKKHFNRDTNARKGLRIALCRALLERGEIITTKPKSREVKRWMDKLMTKAQKSDLAARRQLQKFFGKRSIANTMVDGLAGLFGERKSGFTRINFNGFRKGDNAPMYKVAFVNGVTGTSFKKEEVKKKEVKNEEKGIKKLNK
jgi:large subunit ribosomal protein L17